MVKVVGLLVLGGLLFFAVMALYGVYRRRRASKPRGLGARALRRTLLKLTNDPKVAKRLLDNARDRHPGLSEAALLRKVIRQLRRDRR